eukprot:11218260-Lingulodinium_polyedra.AAC.1
MDCLIDRQAAPHAPRLAILAGERRKCQGEPNRAPRAHANGRSRELRKIKTAGRARAPVDGPG